METMRKAARLTDKEDKGKQTLNAKLWGQLQEHIPLQTIYEKLMQQDLFRLRLVSKEWNHAALQWVLPKPSFVTIAFGVNKWDLLFLNGIVSYNSVSDKFQFHRQRLPLCLIYDGSHVPPFEVEGLILCHNPDDIKERGVFNVHTQTWHVIPPAPKRSETMWGWAGPELIDTKCACGLLVDTTVKPYTFKLVEGHINFNTQIYDSKSRSWSITSSRSPPSFMMSVRNSYDYSCISNNNEIYICDSSQTIWKYSLEDDKWTVLRFPDVSNYKYFPRDNVLGVWEGRIFITREDYKKERVSVWELVDSKGQEWVEYACMPKELYKWLWKCDYDRSEKKMSSRAFFRDGYVLVCSWRYYAACAHALALFNIATKSWRKVDLPRGTVGVEDHEPERYKVEIARQWREIEYVEYARERHLRLE